MRRLLDHLPALFGLFLASATPLTAQTTPTLEERIIRLDEGQKALAQRIDDMSRLIDGRIGDTNRRIDDLRTDVNQRFDDLLLWLQSILGVLVLVVAGFVAQWIVMWRRLIHVETTVSDHLQIAERDQTIVQLRQELTAATQRVDRLEASRS